MECSPPGQTSLLRLRWLSDGTSDAYDGGMDNTAMGSFVTGLAEDNGREILIGATEHHKIFALADLAHVLLASTEFLFLE